MLDNYRIAITKEAQSDLEGIAKYIRVDSPQNAVLVSKAISAAIDALSSFPTRFKSVSRSRRRKSAIHAMVVWPFIVYYRVEARNEMVFVLNIIHGARRQPRRFG